MIYKKSHETMKKFIPYLFLYATTLHTFLGASPVMAMGCAAHSKKAEVVCEAGDIECQKKSSETTFN